MRLTRLELKNWKNFTNVSVKLAPRVFIVGNNGTGKSNLLDALRFLRDIANPKGGGLQSALEKRGGMKQVRSLFARSKPEVGICVEVETEDGDGGKSDTWRYELFIRQEQRGERRPMVRTEVVLKNGKPALERPHDKDKKDQDRLTQTALEQTVFNQNFRVLAEFFQKFKYLHIVPQLIRHGAEIQGKALPGDPFGQNFMNAIAEIPDKFRRSRLRRIGKALARIKPDFSSSVDLGMEYFRDDKTGMPHIKYQHPNWRSRASWRTEEILSDGELRLIGLLWTLLESNPVILLEEPELSFNEGIVEELPNLFSDAMETQKKGRGARQVIMTTHSCALLSDEDIKAEEVIILTPGKESTQAVQASEDESFAREMEEGIPAAQVVLRRVQSGSMGHLFGK